MSLLSQIQVKRSIFLNSVDKISFEANLRQIGTYFEEYQKHIDTYIESKDFQKSIIFDNVFWEGGTLCDQEFLPFCSLPIPSDIQNDRRELQELNQKVQTFAQQCQNMNQDISTTIANEIRTHNSELKHSKKILNKYWQEATKGALDQLKPLSTILQKLLPDYLRQLQDIKRRCSEISQKTIPNKQDLIEWAKIHQDMNTLHKELEQKETVVFPIIQKALNNTLVLTDIVPLIRENKYVDLLQFFSVSLKT